MEEPWGGLVQAWESLKPPTSCWSPNVENPKNYGVGGAEGLIEDLPLNLNVKRGDRGDPIA